MSFSSGLSPTSFGELSIESQSCLSLIPVLLLLQTVTAITCYEFLMSNLPLHGFSTRRGSCCTLWHSFVKVSHFHFVFESVTNVTPIREGTLILLSITLFDRKERLPEDLLYDYTFSMSSILRIFLLFFYFPSKCLDCTFLHPYFSSISIVVFSQFPDSFLHESDADVQETQVPAQKEESRLEETDFHTELQTEEISNTCPL